MVTGSGEDSRKSPFFRPALEKGNVARVCRQATRVSVPSAVSIGTNTAGLGPQPRYGLHGTPIAERLEKQRQGYAVRVPRMRPRPRQAARNRAVASRDIREGSAIVRSRSGIFPRWLPPRLSCLPGAKAPPLLRPRNNGSRAAHPCHFHYPPFRGVAAPPFATGNVQFKTRYEFEQEATETTETQEVGLETNRAPDSPGR